MRGLGREKGLSQERLGEMRYLQRTYTGDIEWGEKNVTLVTAEKLAKLPAFGTRRLTAKAHNNRTDPVKE